MGGGDAHCECHRPCDSHPSPSYPPSLFPPFTLAQEPPPCPSLHGRHPRSRSTGTTALPLRSGYFPRAPASAGARNFRGRRHLHPLGPRRKGEPDETLGAPSARPSPPCARPSHPARLTHGPRTFPPPCTAHASLARRACTSLLNPLPCCAQALDAATPPMPPRSRCRLAPRCRHA